MTHVRSHVATINLYRRRSSRHRADTATSDRPGLVIGGKGQVRGELNRWSAREHPRPFRAR